MDINAMIEDISFNINNNKDTNIKSLKINKKFYTVKVIPPKNNQDINIAYVLLIPETNSVGNRIIIESNNYEGDNNLEMLHQISYTIKRLVLLSEIKPTPIVVPIIPKMDDVEPYYRQLSKECFELDSKHIYYRIDLQLAKIIENVQDILQNEFGISTYKKVFMNGYSSSGVFAQRFALLHPELVDTLCVGGAVGTIPIPTKKLEYPIGIKDYQELFGKEFDKANYLKIKHRYYVGELEDIALSNDRTDENNNKAPLHDMTYFNRSVPSELGIKMRNILGIKLIPRFRKVVELLKNEGLDIHYTIFPDRTHNDQSGRGVNELGDAFINNAYIECINNEKNIKDLINDNGSR